MLDDPVVRGGRAECACYKGYISNGLDCLSIDIFRPTNESSPKEVTPPNAPVDDDSTLIAALDGFDVTPLRKGWNSEKQDREYAEYVESNFTDYLEKVFRLRASGGGVLIILGACSSLGSLGLHVLVGSGEILQYQ